MMTREAGFLALLFLGVSALLAGMLVTRLHWRPDIPPYGRQTRFLDVTLHPERYVKDAPLSVIRTMSVIGVLLLACALAVLAYEIANTIWHS